MHRGRRCSRHGWRLPPPHPGRAHTPPRQRPAPPRHQQPGQRRRRVPIEDQRLETPVEASQGLRATPPTGDHVGAAYDAIDVAAADGEPFDVVHDHSGFTAVAMAARVSVPVVHTPRAVHRRDTPVLHPSRPRSASSRSAAISSSTRRPASASRTWCLTRSGSRTGRFTSTRTTICCGWAGWIQSRARDRNRAPGRHPARARGAGATRAGGLLPQRDRAAPRRRHGAVRRRGGRHAPKGSCSRARRRS
jgi:hypothetical protein